MYIFLYLQLSDNKHLATKSFSYLYNGTTIMYVSGRCGTSEKMQLNACVIHCFSL